MVDFQKLHGSEFARYLNEIMGGEYNITYVERPNPVTNKPDDERYSFYHITHLDKTTGTYLPLNIKINLGHRTEFDTTYGLTDQQGKPMPSQKEWAPEILTKQGTSGYGISGVWTSMYEADQQAGKDEWGASDQLLPPTHNLAQILTNAFKRTRQEIQRGHQKPSVYSNVIKEVTEGNVGGVFDIPKGALLNTRSDVNATRLQNARSIQTKNVYDPTISTSEFEQRRRLEEHRMSMIENRTEIMQPVRTVDPTTGEVKFVSQAAPLSRRFKELGLVPDRESDERLVMTAQGVTGVVSEPYLPSKKVLKHATILWRGRQTVDPLDVNYQPLQAQPITPRSGPFGYRRTTADIGERIPEEAFVMGTIISTQTLSPGAGYYFPENMGGEMEHVGYKKARALEFTPDIAGLISGDVQIERGEQAIGTAVPGLQSQVAARVKYRGSDDFVDIQEKLGASGYYVGSDRLVVPRYIHTRSGMGAEYNQALEQKKIIRQLNKAEIRALEKRTGMPVELSDLATTASYVREGYNIVGAKFADVGEKTEVLAMGGRPTVKVTPAKLAGRELPVSKISYETKSFPEMVAGAFAGMSVGTQEDLLSRYAETLADDRRYQKRVETAIRELERDRSRNPEMRLNLSAFGDRIGMPAHELMKDVVKNVILQGRTLDQMEAMSEQELEEFALSPHNQEMLARYNMGYVAPSMVEPISETWSRSNYNVQLASYHAYLNTPEGQAERNLNSEISKARAQELFNREFGFATQGLGDEDDVPRNFTPSGFYIAPAQRPRVEFPGGGAIGAEDITVMNTVMPNFASRLGLSLRDLTGSGAMHRAENLRNPTRWAAQQAAYLSMLNASVSAQVPDIPNATVIDRDIASKMVMDTEFMEYLEDDKYANLQGMRKFSEKFAEFFPDVNKETLLGKPVMYSAAQGRYQISPKAMSFLTTEDIATRTDEEYSGEDLTRIWNQYRQMTATSIRGTEDYDPDDVSGIDQNKIIESQQKLANYFMAMFGLPEGGKRNIIKKLLGSDRQAVKTRYSFAPGLKQEEVFADDELWRQMIRRSAMSDNVDLTPEEEEEIFNMISGAGKQKGKELVLSNTPDYIRDYGVPGYVQRYPVTGTKDSGFGVRYITRSHLERQGREVPYGGGGAMGRYWFRMGLGLPGVMQGDEDLDPSEEEAGIRIKRLRGGKLAVRFAGLRPGGGADPQIEEAIERTRTFDYLEEQANQFTSLEQQRKFNPFMGAFMDKGFGGLRGFTRNLMATQMRAANWYNFGDFYDTVANYKGSKLQMGVTYDFTRMMAAAAEAGGWSREGVARMGQRRGEIYQPFLDFASGTPHPLVNMFQTAKITQGKQGLGLTWSKARETVFDPVDFISPEPLRPQNAIKTLRHMATTALSPRNDRELLSPETFAGLFSPNEALAYRPERDTVEQLRLNRERQRMEEDIAAGVATEQQQLDYYSQISLQEATEPAYFAETDKRRRSVGMLSAFDMWLKAQIGDTPEEAQKANIFRGMFAKGLGAAERNIPGWEPPSDWASQMPSQEMMAEARKTNPLWNLMRGRLMSSDVAQRFFHSLGEEPSGIWQTWARGAMESMGFGELRSTQTNNFLYEEAMSKPIEVRGSLLGAMAGYGPYYGTRVTAGGKKGTYYKADSDVRVMQDLAMRKQTAYTISNLLGIERSKANEWVGALFPRKENKFVEEGQRIEAELGALMSGEWFGATNIARDETGQLIPTPKTDLKYGYHGSAVWEGEMQGEQFVGSAKSDFVRLLQNEGEEPFLQFIEQKSPGRDITQNQLRKRLGGEKLQSMYPVWLMNQNVKDLESGIPELMRKARERIEGFVETHFPSQGGDWRENPEHLRSKAYEAIVNRRMGSTMLFTRREGQAERMIAEGDKPGIRQWLENHPLSKKVRWRYAGENDPEYQKLEKAINTAVEGQIVNRPRLFESLQAQVVGAPTFYKTLRETYRNRGKSVRGINDVLELVNISRARMQEIARGAMSARAPELDLGGAVGQGQTETLFSRVREEAGEAFAQYIQQDPNADEESWTRTYEAVQSQIMEKAGAGEQLHIEVPGMYSPTIMQQAYQETAAQMGFSPQVSAWQRGETFGFTMGFRPQPDISQDREYRKMQGVLKRYGTLRAQAVESGDQERANRMAQKWQSQQDKINAYRQSFGQEPPSDVPPPPVTPPPPEQTQQPPPPSPTPPTPSPNDDDDESKYDPDVTRKASILATGMYAWRQPIEQARIAIRQQFGGGVLADSMRASGMTQEQITEALQEHLPAALKAQEFYKTAKFLSTKQEQIDPSRVPQGVFGTIDELMDVSTPVGGDITDVMSVLENITKEGREGARAILSGKKAAITPAEEIQKEYFSRLGEASDKLTKSFENMARHQGDYSKNLQDSVKQQLEIARLEKLEKIEQAAAPLLEQGLLGRAQGAGLGQGLGAGPSMPADTSALTAEQQQQIARYKTAQTELAKFEAEVSSVPEEKGLGSFFRKTLSGFGMMYLRSIMNFMTSGLDTGVGERQQMDAVFGRSAIGLTGGMGAVPVNQQIRMSNQRALYGADRQVIPWAVNAAQTTPILSDIVGAGTAGLGSFAAMSWMGGMPGAPAWMSNASVVPQVAMGIAATQMVLSGIQQAQDPEGLAYQISRPGGLYSPKNILGGLFSSQAQQEDVIRKRNTYQLLRNQLLRAPTFLEGMEIPEEKLEALRIYGDRPASETFEMAQMAGADLFVSPEKQGWYVQAQQQLLLEQFPDIAPEVAAETYSMMTLAGMAPKDYEQLARLRQTGGITEKPFEQMLAATGMPISQMYESGAIRDLMERVAQGEYSTMDMLKIAGGAERISSLGQAGIFRTRGLTPQDIERYAVQLEGMGAMDFAGYAGAMDVWSGWQTLGRVSPMPAPSDFANLSAAQLGQLDIGNRLQTRQQASVRGIGDVLAQYLGYTPEGAWGTAEMGTQGMGQGELDRLAGELEGIAAIIQKARELAPDKPESYFQDLQNRYSSYSYSEGWGGELMGKPGTIAMIQAAQGGDPFALAQAYQYGIDVPGKNVNAISGGQRDVWQTGPMAGMVANLAPFTVSGQAHPWFNQLQQMLTPEILGSEVGQAFQFGYQMEGTNLPAIAGTMGMQMYMQDRRWNLQERQQALSGGYAAIQREYLPQIWALQDKQTALGYEQQQWSFGRSLEGLQMGARQQNEQWALALRQTEMQRGWTREDWRFQDQQRSQQWGWQVEDFEENVRFMTGRQRRLAERQMERQTITKGQEDERIDIQRKRQEETWALEDERFDLQRQHAEENRKFQQEGIEKQREFYEEQFKLQRQLTDLQREMQMKQLALNEAQIALQKEMFEEAKRQEQIQTAIQVLSLLNQTYLDNEKVAREGIKGLSEETNVLQNEAFTAINNWLLQFMENFGIDVPQGGGGGSGAVEETWMPNPSLLPTNSNSTWTPPKIAAWGDLAWTGGRTLVGETGPEIIELTGSGLYSEKRGEIRPTMYDPWQSQQIGTVQVQDSAKPTIIVVNVGNEELKRFVVDAVQQEI